MSVSARTTRKSVSTDTSGPAEKAVLAVSEKNRKYVAKVPTANLAAFAAFVVKENEGTYKTKAENEAFVLGVRLAGLRSAFQIDRKAGNVPADVSFVDYALGTSGIDVPTGAARTALIAGIGSYTRYTSFRDARNAKTASSK